MNYIKVPKVIEKLEKAEASFLPVVIMAATGYGKSAAVKYYYQRKKYLMIKCLNGKLEYMPDIEKITQKYIIIEDAQWVDSAESYEYIRTLLRMKDKQIVIIKRGIFPKYLMRDELEVSFIKIVESDLMFGKEQVEQIFKERNIPISEDDTSKIAEITFGYPIAIFYYAEHIKETKHFSQKVIDDTWNDMFRLWDTTLIAKWTDEFIKFALSVCQYEIFSEEMAVYLTGNSRISKVMEYCFDGTSQLKQNENGEYFLHPAVKLFFCWEQKMRWTDETIKENYKKGAYFYEMNNDIEKALFYYRKAGSSENIKNLLIKNAHKHPGIGHYIETKDYYLSLPKEEITRTPVLTAAVSMLYDLILQPERSAEYYDELIKFERDCKNAKDKRKEARTWLAYLDISLPHKGTKGILRTIKNIFASVNKGDIVLPEVSETDNLPSIMNGGLDFSEWSKSDIQITKCIKEPIETILGKGGKGLVTIALAESGFEKGTMSPYEVVTRCSDGYESAAHGGRIEICFVATGVMARQHIVEGQFYSAKRVYQSFKNRVLEEKANHLLQNMEVFETWLALYENNSEKIKKYIDKATDARSSFFSFDRFRSMINIRCLIAENRLSEAAELSLFLTGYFEKYERHFLWMENEILKAVIFYRMNDEHYKSHIKNAIKRAEEYHFVRLISLEGNAVLQILKEMKKDGEFDDISSEYVDITLSETAKIAYTYPDYLKYYPQKEIKLTKREKEILSMLCIGMSMNEICENCGISMNGLKKHNSNIYRKLEASNRAEAERNARAYGIIF